MADKRKLSRKTTQDNFVTEKIDVIKNNLLGSYDDEGNYIIATQIVSELLKLDKVKKTSFGNSVFCVGNLLGYGEIVFELLFDSKSHNGKSASATLYLLEDVDKINGYLQNTIKTKLEDFNEDVENFIEETYSHFNISTDDDDDDDDVKEEKKLLDDLDNEESFIIAKKQYSLLLDKLLDEKFLDAYGKYFTSRISVLTKLDNEFSKTVLDRFNAQYSLIENMFLQEKNYKTLNELLDKCVEEISGTNELFVSQEKEFAERTAGALEVFVDSVNKLNDRFEPKALNMLDKADREKVEELLDEQQNTHEESNTYESKPSVEQMVNDVSKPKTREEEQVIKQSEVEKQDTQGTKQNKEKETIKETQVDEKAPEQSGNTIPQQSFYEAFRGAHASPQVNKQAKVVDTAMSSVIDSPESEGKAATLSLKDRIKRLEKFKETNVAEEAEITDNGIVDMYNTLSRERSRKDSQVDEKNARTRTQLAEDYLRRQQAQRERVDEREM